MVWANRIAFVIGMVSNFKLVGLGSPVNEAKQKAMCDQHGVLFLPPVAGSRVGIAIETLGLQPLNGMRIEPEEGISGWYLWAGREPSKAEDFFKPLCVEHLVEHCPLSLPFLALPPGWRFQLDGEYIDVWYDGFLLEEYG